jgi:hypothetical protein
MTLPSSKEKNMFTFKGVNFILGGQILPIGGRLKTGLSHTRFWKTGVDSRVARFLLVQYTKKGRI